MYKYMNMYVYIHMYIYIYIYTQTHVCIYGHTWIDAAKRIVASMSRRGMTFGRRVTGHRANDREGRKGMQSIR